MKISALIGTVLMVLAAQNGVAGVSYPVVDTGQTVAYGDYNGQDAHYSANAPSRCRLCHVL